MDEQCQIAITDMSWKVGTLRCLNECWHHLIQFVQTSCQEHITETLEELIKSTRQATDREIALYANLEHLQTGQHCSALTELSLEAMAQYSRNCLHPSLLPLTPELEL